MTKHRCVWSVQVQEASVRRSRGREQLIEAVGELFFKEVLLAPLESGLRISDASGSDCRRVEECHTLARRHEQDGGPCSGQAARQVAERIPKAGISSAIRRAISVTVIVAATQVSEPAAAPASRYHGGGPRSDLPGQVQQQPEEFPVHGPQPSVIWLIISYASPAQICSPFWYSTG